jgi:alkyldihydroxyacetonephosphate synthase
VTDLRPGELAAELRELLPAMAVLTDEPDLRARARDWWPLARLREVRGDRLSLPAAVVLPRSTDEVAAMMAWASRTGTPIVPRGLGSGVCGAVTPSPRSVVLELSSMDRVLDLDRESRLIHVEAGIRGDDLEAALAAEGGTLGHYPQSMAISTVGGWISAWSAGQASPGYGQIEDRLAGLTAVLADGSIVRLTPRPRHGAGPDLRRLFLGAEGTHGVVTEAHLAWDAADPRIVWRAFGYPAFETVLGAGRDVLRAGIGARVNRGWDETDTRHGFADQTDPDRPCLGVVGVAASAPGLDGRLDAVARMAAEHDGREIDAGVGERWWSRRLDAVDAFERLMGPRRELGPGSLIDTFEPAALWRDLPRVYRSVRAALEAHTSEVRCHFSHVYPTGAALYFTFVLREATDDQVERVYLAAWRDALAACQEQGGSVAHHHGLGRVKSDAWGADVGASAADLMRRIKGALDPAGILNPGVLGTPDRLPRLNGAGRSPSR